MTVTINLSDEQAAVLQAEAAHKGITLDALLQNLAEEYAKPRSSERREGPDPRPVGEIISEHMKGVPPEVLDRLPRDGQANTTIISTVPPSEISDRLRRYLLLDCAYQFQR